MWDSWLQPREWSAAPPALRDDWVAGYPALPGWADVWLRPSGPTLLADVWRATLRAYFILRTGTIARTFSPLLLWRVGTWACDPG